MNKTLKVLLVDDDKDFRETLVEVITRRAQIEFVEAANGLEALIHLKNGGFDCVVTDTNMPKMNGIELLQCCRAYAPKVNVCVLFSGLNGSSLGADDVLALGATLVADKTAALPLLLKEFKNLAAAYRDKI